MATYIKNWFSNMTVSPIIIDGINYPSIENVYQAAKTSSMEERQRIVKLHPNASKKAGHTVKLKDDWESIKLAVMYVALSHKFEQPQWKAQLQATGSEYLVEWNNWNDSIWGIPCKIAQNGFAIPNNRSGNNYLGRLLMLIRDSNININDMSLDDTDGLKRVTSILYDKMPSVPDKIVYSTTHYETCTMPSDRISVAVYGSEITLITPDIVRSLDNTIALGGQIHLCEGSALTIVIKEYRVYKIANIDRYSCQYREYSMG
jgi:ribA/ribD-fused uncharacterized protein